MSEVVFVGTSDAFGAGGRRQSALLVRAPQRRRCCSTAAPPPAPVSPRSGSQRDEIDAILVSHFHGDHFGGIPALLLAALYEDERRKPLRVAGPPGIERRVHQLAAAMGYAIEERDWSFPIEFFELAPERTHRDRPGAGPQLRDPPPAAHASPRPGGRPPDGSSIGYSGDTGWFDELPRRVARRRSLRLRVHLSRRRASSST